MNFYPHHIGDFDRATRHLTRVERSVYRDLLDVYYDTEKELTLDLPALCRKIIAKSNEEITAVEQTLNEFFTKTSTGWYHNRCEEEISKYHANNTQKSQAGKASAAAKALKKQQALNGNSTGVERTNNGTPTNQEPRTKNQEPNTSEAIASGGKPPLTPAEIIFGYGVPILTNAGTAEKQARSFLGGLRKAHGDDALVNALRDCIRAKPLQPLEWLAKAMLPDATGAPAETLYQRSKREQMERDFPNLTNKTEFPNVASIELD